VENGQLIRLLKDLVIGFTEVREKVSVQVIEHCGVLSEVDCFLTGEGTDGAIFCLKLINFGRMGLFIYGSNPVGYGQLVTNKFVKVLTEAECWG